MGIRNWKEYNQDLVKRGNLTFYIDRACLNPPPKNTHTRGRPRQFTHPLIQILLLLKIQYRLTYRTLEGFGKSFLPLIKQDILLPTYSLICRRAPELEDLLPKLSRRRAQVIMLDSSGIKVSGEGEWKVKVHGKAKRRKWIKVHIAVDAKTQEILQLEVTDSFCSRLHRSPKAHKEMPGKSKALFGRWGIRHQRLQKSHTRERSSSAYPSEEKC